MAFLDRNGLQTLTNKLVDGDTIKVSSHRGVTLENVIDNLEREYENVSNPLEYNLENRVNEFRVGQGRDVDASGDVETGCSEIGLQGRTWQNLCATSEISQIFDTDGAKVLIQLLKVSARNMFKANTTYTVILDFALDNYIGKNELSMVYLEATCSNSEKPTIFIPIQGTKQFRADGKYFTVVKFTTISDMTQMNSFYLAVKDCSGSLKLNSSIILEGDHTQTPVEELPQYFEGIQSSFEDGKVEIENVGKNLFDGLFLNKAISSTSGSMSNSDVNITTGYIEIDNKRKYYVSGLDSSCRTFVTFYDNSHEFISRTSGSTFTSLLLDNIPNNATYCVLYYYGNESISQEQKKELIKNLQIECSSKPTQYEPHKKDILSRELDIPLRSLPNGVCDEIIGDKHIQRVGKVVLDGTLSVNIWTNSPASNNYIRFYFFNDNIVDTGRPKNGSVSICDKFPRITSAYTAEVANHYFVNDYLGISMPVSNIPNFYELELIQMRSSLNEWLSQNPVTVYYELAEPIITPIEPLITTTKPLGHYTIKSDIAPVSTHTVQLNRAGQIERAIVDIAELKKRVEKLETIYDSNFLETAHKLELLGMDYELESEEV